MTEAELLHALDAHDALVRACARGALTWAAFDAAYDTFYVRYALDGHESSQADRVLLAKHADRIELHAAIWEHVLTKVTSVELVQGRFISPDTAVRRLQDLLAEHGG